MTMKTIETNALLVLSVDSAGAIVAANGRNTMIDWDTLRRAVQQEDAELRRAYSALLTAAEDMAADGPVEVSVEQDSTNVWWVAGVTAAWGGGYANYHRRADEGGTQPNHLCAAIEAADICDRLGSRVVRRIGFDGAAARRQREKIMSRS